MPDKIISSIPLEGVEVIIVFDQVAVGQSFTLTKVARSPRWTLKCNGKELDLRDDQAAAIAALFIGGLEGDVEKALYELAEPVAAQLPDEDRMIP